MQGNLTIIKTNGTKVEEALTAPPGLDWLQSAVGGNIETVPYMVVFNGQPCVAFCNEEGKLHHLQVNEIASEAWRAGLPAGFQPLDDVLVGDVVILTGDDDFLEAL